MFLRSISSLYGPGLPAAVITKLRQSNFRPDRLLAWFWQTRSFQSVRPLNDSDQSLAVLLWLGILAQLSLGVALLVEWARFGTAGAWEFGIALLLSYPLVWVHVLAFGAAIYQAALLAAHPKRVGRQMVCAILEYQVKRLRKRHTFQVVAVVGSVGKTSTKLAIADLLGQTKRVRAQTGNYNDRVTVPLVFFGTAEPNILNVFAWLRVFWTNHRVIRQDYPFDVVVIELGTDAPGQLADFAYLQPDISVVTAVSPEHMEFFADLNAVAAEELSIFDFSEMVLVNGDDVAGQYLAGRTFSEYSLVSHQAEYVASAKGDGLRGQTLDMKLAGEAVRANIHYVGKQGAKFALAAAAVATVLKVPAKAITVGLPNLQPFAGRLQVLAGVQQTTLIDDTYNASPIAVTAALDVLYAAKTSQRIAILGSMNELGEYAQAAHQTIGAYCDPKKLALVVTIGSDAKAWLAPAATQAGCEVVSFDSPYQAGTYVKDHVKKGAVVLAKGSQNGVFAEEALKLLLENPTDVTKLVRQSPHWLKQKAKQFPR